MPRKNSYNGHKTPWDIIRERTQDIKPNVVALPPVFLDELFMKKLDQKPKGGYGCYSVSLPKKQIPLTYNHLSHIAQYKRLPFITS